MATGRPSLFTQKLSDDICAKLADGKSLSSICKEKGMPSTTAVFSWLAKHEQFADAYARAREAQAVKLAEEILEIADETAFDTIDREGGGKSANSEWINRSRLRVDARKWLASKMFPKKYGERIAQEVSGADGSPLTIEIVRFSNEDKE